MIVDLNDLSRDDAVAAVRALEVELFAGHAWSENAIRQELSAPARTYVFDVEDAPASPDARTSPNGGGTPAVRGFAGYWYDGDDAEVMDIGVGKAYQRHGIAAGLLGRLIDSARRQGARRMLLEVAVDNAPAIALYRRFGFENIGLRKRYYQPEGTDAHVMALELNPRPVGFQPSHAPQEQDHTDRKGTAQ
ncbi:GNAT family N-acetyltransferase [Bifidobacterium avesanii]|uniref:GNAT family N-acetyltransferase n=1 Tax=Bifidobacterium avesanii TaxID=1798157 RepID=A0A7K3TFQ3_9BIFI|nr:GNAT family N-acetyltransferase [Bifidobacterium avesanii]KAB8295509.1 ribosomal-protein-alanine N-acetyltransferase [Bifidobacterium avesanii]NEG77514.1 GNAT family N-acetyltransferase [Bifidobacterium avesanii]